VAGHRSSDDVLVREAAEWAVQRIESSHD
jgi:hypothetical protein